MHRILALLLLPAMAHAVETEVTWQGRITNATGNPVAGVHPVLFQLWSDETSTDTLDRVWFEQIDVTFSDGYGSAILGESGGLNVEDFSGDVWLGVTVDPPGTEFSPRTKVTGSPGSVATFRVPNDTSACNGSSGNDGTLRWTGTELDVCTGAGGWRTIVHEGHRYWRSYKTDAATGGSYHRELLVLASGAPVPVTVSMLTSNDLNVWTPSGLLDNSVSSNGFHTDNADPGAWMQIDFGPGNEQPLTEWRYYVGPNQVYATWDIQYSDNGTSWTTVATGFDMRGAEGWRTVTW